MSLSSVTKLNNKLDQYKEVRDAIESNSGSIQLTGLTGAAKGFILSELLQGLRRPTLVITYSSEQADRLADDLSQFGYADDDIFVLPPSDALIYEEGAPDFRVIGQRLAAMDSLLTGKPVVVVAPVNGALRRTMPPDTLRKSRVILKVGESIDSTDFARHLVDLGYERTEICEMHGEFSMRGGIIDIYASNENDPVRIELFGDEVESIRIFDSASQRSSGHKKQILILPAREMVLTLENAENAAEVIKSEVSEQIRKLQEAGQREDAERLESKVDDDISRLTNLSYFHGIESYLPYIHPEEHSILDFLPAFGLVVIDEPHQAATHWEQHENEMVEVLINRANRGLLLASTRSQHVPMEDAIKRLTRKWQTLYLSALDREISYAQDVEKVAVESAPMETYAGQVDMLAEQIKTWVENGSRVVISTGQRERTVELMTERNIPISSTEELETTARPGVYVASGMIRSGFKLPDIALMFLTDNEVFGVVRNRRPRRVAKEGVPISTILDLKEGDFIVHVSHGIGVYRGITRLETGGITKDYLLLEYAAQDKLYVPTDQIDRVQKYIGGEGTAPVIHKLGGSEWARATKRAKAAVQIMAKELIELYAWRQAVGGYSFSPDSPWQQEMESAFPYEETPDQLQAIEDVKRDLEDPKPMDRLICGDVGFGKTEVAIRAAFKVVNEGKQVAVLAPTTVLAQQHLNTFAERLGAFPITTGLLSRFRSKKEIKETIEGMKIGTVDIVIGTHRLLSKDIQFKDLGLLIIDEEQRFGVGHKERLRQIKKTVDTLAMTATPIPRTLHMSLAGIRDMSVIEDPPQGRTPVKTFVREYDEEIVREAVVRELDRGGQIYFIHNRVDDISHVAAHISKLVPYARVEVAHGQMAEDDLERVMLEFYDRKFDVLVCTTIVESGLDIPNVNTIIIDSADKMGLAQLYQLRGRVGRSDKQAYAYLMFSSKMLTEIAEKRLDAIREFTDLGSGFKLALRDLEIRGAGNLLGAEQHGQIVAIGFDLYCQLLSQAISEMKGEDVEEIQLPPVDLPLDAYIPEDYIRTEAQRVFFYKKIAAAKAENEVRLIQEELEDRFGDPPKSVWNMLAVLRLRIRAADVGVSSISMEKRQIVIRFANGFRLLPDIQKDLIRQYKRHWFQADMARLNPDSPRVINLVEDMVEIVGKALRLSAKRMKSVVG